MKTVDGGAVLGRERAVSPPPQAQRSRQRQFDLAAVVPRQEMNMGFAIIAVARSLAQAILAQSVARAQPPYDVPLLEQHWCNSPKRLYDFIADGYQLRTMLQNSLASLKGGQGQEFAAIETEYFLHKETQLVDGAETETPNRTLIGWERKVLSPHITSPSRKNVTSRRRAKRPRGGLASCSFALSISSLFVHLARAEFRS